LPFLQEVKSTDKNNTTVTNDNNFIFPRIILITNLPGNWIIDLVTSHWVKISIFPSSTDKAGWCKHPA